MKLGNLLIIISSSVLSGANAFAPVRVPHAKAATLTTTTTTATWKAAATATSSSSWTELSMFSGAGDGGALAGADDPEMEAKMEEQARAMGISTEELKLSIAGRDRLGKALLETRVTGGSADTVLVERDGNNPSRFLEVTISQGTKDKGKDELSKALVRALKEASTASNDARMKEQKEMMAWIGEEMKKRGMK